MTNGKSPKGRHILTRLAWLVFLLVLLFSSLVWIARAQKPEGGDELPPIDPALRLKIEPALLKQLIESDGGRASIVVEMKAAANLQAAVAEPDPARRRQAVISTLQATAQQSQGGALALLAEREAAGAASNARSFWIFNGLAAEADLDTVLALAERPEVRIVRRDREYHLADRPQSSPGTLPNGQGVEWNIAQIRADLARNALNVDGSGVVVANIDSGVDFLHPALLTRYRGYDPHGLHVHTCNWFDATGEGATYPVDGNEHGTHTMGTIVGGEGIGVAPGAAWIAVRAFDSQGVGLESWLHAAMQWVVDPGPGCTSPDVVNNSWGNDWGGADVFRADVQNMRAAGIFAPFSAGNHGPYSSSIGAPASYPEAFGVGAVTADDVIASFSGRGPSSWYGSNLVKPEVSAPGVDVRSSLPGGAYGKKDGTSMATPHVAGLAALMLQADPSLTVSQIETIIKNTAVRLGSPIPNNSYGWGRIDAYAAVAAVANAGTVTGDVVRAADSTPIASATVKAEPSTPGPAATTLTGGDGTYTLALAPDRYTLTASAFGYAPQSRSVEVITASTIVTDFALTALPTGTLTGQVTSGGLPVAPPATIAVEGTPVAVTTDAGGFYSAYLPGGSYTLTVTSPGHRVAVAFAVPITAGETTVRDFDLITAPTILLVDGGAWYYDSQIDYYRQSLDELRYAYDLWTVSDSTGDVPAAGDLLPYDIVFWSSPQDSPGYVNAGGALAAYLDGGGSLFLSGQDVAYYDDFYIFVHAPYFNEYIKADFVGDNSGAFDLTGEAGGLFEGLSFAIYGPGGANNQNYPDEVSVTEPDFASSLVRYDGDGSGGQQVGLCLPYRVVYLSYGFEAINDSATRTEVISRSIAWFTTPPSPAGIELTPESESLVGDFGSTVAHTLRVRNTAETGSAEKIDLATAGFAWPTSLATDEVTLAPCASAQVMLTVQVPPVTAWAAADSVTITAQSAALSVTATRETRAPAPVLLVDDGRFYDVEDHYQDALNANGIPYDEWTVPWSFVGSVPPSPPAETLQMYPMVIWFSAYDWNLPLVPEEEARLAAYLDGGGRLYYNGQDYLFHTGGPNGFGRDYLGVDGYAEDFISTVVSGVVGNPVGSYLKLGELAYPYQNFSDALTPTTSASVAFVGQEGQPNALTNVGPGWRTTFFAFNPDGLSSAANERLMQRVAGWLSWLGGSTVGADKSLARDTDTLTYAVVLRNDGWQDMASSHFTATFTGDLTPDPASGSGGATWDAGQSAFVWSGPLAQGQSLTFTYQADVNGPLPVGHVVSHTVWMGYDSHSIEFDRIATTSVNLPAWLQSTFSVTPTVGEVDASLTYTLRVSNSGVVDGLVTVTNRLPDSLAPISDTLQVSSGITQTDGRSVTWTVPVSEGEFATLNYAAIITGVPPGFVLRNRATLDDDLGNTLPLDAVATVEGVPVFVPIILKGTAQ